MSPKRKRFKLFPTRKLDPFPLLKLPNELLLVIASHLGSDPQDLSKLLRTNRRLASLLTPRLYSMLVSQKLDHYPWSDTRVVLSRAASMGHDRVVRLLAERGVSMITPAPYQDPPPHIAAYHGHVSVIKAMLDYAAEDVLYLKNGEERTPLLVSVLQGHVEVVKAIFDKGDKVELLNQRAALCKFDNRVDMEAPYGVTGATALHYAANCGHDVMVKFLLEQGAAVDVKTSDEAEKTPLQQVCGNCYFLLLYRDPNAIVRTVKILLENGAKTTSTDRDGRTPVHNACMNGEYWSLTASRVKGRQRNVDLERRYALGKASHKVVVKLLLENGVDINAQDKTGRTALHYAAERWQGYMIRHLLDLGANINAKTLNGETPLHLAAGQAFSYIRDRTLAIPCLLENGADITIEDFEGNTALDLAKFEARLSNEKKRFAKLLRQLETETDTPPRSFLSRLLPQCLRDPSQLGSSRFSTPLKRIERSPKVRWRM